MLNNHFVYKNDETSMANYCASITMYPWLLNGTMEVGGNSKAPTNLKAFCGGFINMVFIVSSMLSGACATPEFLMYMNYFKKNTAKITTNVPTKLLTCLSKNAQLEKLSMIVSNKLFTQSTNRRVQEISKLCSGIFHITISSISKASSVNSASLTELSHIGNLFRGCRNAS